LQALVFLLVPGSILRGYAYRLAGWPGVAGLGLVPRSFSLASGLREMR